MVSNTKNTPKNNTTAKGDPKIKAILPDNYISPVQPAFGIKSTHTWSISVNNAHIIHYTFTQYSLQQGLKEFSIRGKEMLKVEYTQLHDMKVFQPVNWSDFTIQLKL